MKNVKLKMKKGARATTSEDSNGLMRATILRVTDPRSEAWQGPTMPEKVKMRNEPKFKSQESPDFTGLKW
jgi:hypothetical protein